MYTCKLSKVIYRVNASASSSSSSSKRSNVLTLLASKILAVLQVLNSVAISIAVGRADRRNTVVGFVNTGIVVFFLSLLLMLYTYIRFFKVYKQFQIVKGSTSNNNDCENRANSTTENNNDDGDGNNIVNAAVELKESELGSEKNSKKKATKTRKRSHSQREARTISNLKRNIAVGGFVIGLVFAMQAVLSSEILPNTANIVLFNTVAFIGAQVFMWILSSLV